MLYQKKIMNKSARSAGKITVVTALSGVAIFALVFIFNIGKTELQKVEAQFDNGAATTTLTVLNTPPEWTPGLEGREEFESSTTTPTNSGRTISWIGTAVDANNAPYFMIICSTSAAPAPAQAANAFSLGTAPPSCSAGIQWGVSTSTVSGSVARVATSTNEAISPFGESNVWYAWVCDDDPTNARCSNISSQGTNATNSSPFNVNRRPIFTAFGNNGPIDPGQLLSFLSTSTDPDVVDAEDTIFLVVCQADTYSTTTNQCGGGDFLASTTLGVLSNATATRALAAIIQDANYPAYGYIYDQHGHSAVGGAQGTNVQYTVRNVAPTVSGGTISLNGGTDILLTVPGNQTTGFTLGFVVADANSCDAVGGGNADEITNFAASVFRNGVGTSTCGIGGTYNPNFCYPSTAGASVWNISCTASSTSCLGPTDDTMVFNCSFPLWFIADPTDGIITDTPFYNQMWAAGVAGIDNNNATGSMSTSTIDVELFSFVALDLLDELIAYDQLEPGDAMVNLSASTSMRVLGNTGLNQLLGGDSMCGTYTTSNPCPVSSTSTIPQSEQRYGTSSLVYASGISLQPTTTPALLEIQIFKALSTSTPSSKRTHWGISVPASISLAGSYTGQNTFLGVRSAPATW